MLAARHVRFVCSVWVFVVALLAPRVARAQGTPVFVVSSADVVEPVDPAQLRRVVESVGVSAVSGDALSREIALHFASLPLRGDPLAAGRQRTASARQDWSRAVERGDDASAQRAISAVDAAARELEALPEALETNPDNREALRAALLFLAERFEAAGSHTQAEDAMRRLARFDPSLVFTARAASPVVQQMYRAAVDNLPRGGLTVQTEPPACAVLRDGREVGSAPAELRDLTPGTHRIIARCGGMESRVHVVRVAVNSTSTLVVDAQLDNALTLEGPPGLRYASREIAASRAVNDLAVLGRAIGARRVVAFMLATRRVLTVDTAASTTLTDTALDETSAAPANPSSPSDRTTAAVDGQLPRTNPSPVVPRGRGVMVAGYALTMLGVVAGGVAAFFNIASNNAAFYRDTNSDEPRQRDAFESAAQTWRVAAIATYATGGALVVTGVVMISVGAAAGAAPRYSAALVPTGGGCSAVVGGRW